MATLRLGVTTDTGDMSGRVLSTSPVGVVDRTPARDRLPALRRARSSRCRRCTRPCTTRAQRLYELARAGHRGRARAARGGHSRDLEVEDVAGESRPAVASCAAREPTCGRSPPTWARALGCGAAVRAARAHARRPIRARATPRRGMRSRPRPAATLWARVQPAGGDARRLAGAIRLDARATEPVRARSGGGRRAGGRRGWHTRARARGRRTAARSGRGRSAGGGPGRCGCSMQIVRGLDVLPA